MADGSRVYFGCRTLYFDNPRQMGQSRMLYIHKNRENYQKNPENNALSPCDSVKAVAKALQGGFLVFGQRSKPHQKAGKNSSRKSENQDEAYGIYYAKKIIISVDKAFWLLYNIN